MMSFTVFFVFAFAITLSNCFFRAEGNMLFRVPADVGCTSGRKSGLLRHGDVSACLGSWEGHVRQANLCSNGWHVCNWNDTEMLSAISYYEASHIDGCFAINAAQNNGICQECSGRADELAGVGADCPIINTKSTSCIGNGRIDSSCCSTAHGHGACVFRQWMSGVICCRDKKSGTAPTITVSPLSTVRIQEGEKIILTCEAEGIPVPHITWYKNGHPVTPEILNDVVETVDDRAVSRLIISKARRLHNGLYLCKAKNSNGDVISYTSDVTTYRAKPNLAACRNHRHQFLFNSASVAACQGNWKGSVRQSSKQLCGKGWRVCGLRDLTTLQKLPWNEIISLKGCYAYNAATSDNFACTKCSHRQKGNSMSGIGADCGMQKKELNSCLRTGRVDVWNQRNPTKNLNIQPKNAKHSCSYKKGSTSGVMCCKVSHKKKKQKSNHKKFCVIPCGANSHCSRRGVCKCDKGFKLLGETCVAKQLVKSHKSSCSQVKCKNGGKCKKGSCVCPPLYHGSHCEGITSKTTFH